MIYNLLIIGSGPAGYSAGLYAARANLNPILFEGSNLPGGQLTTTTSVENYLGVEENGYELTEKFKHHAIKYGLTVMALQITSMFTDDNEKTWTLVDELAGSYKTRSVIIATGASAKRLGLPSESIYWNNGISACAVCDGALPMFRNRPVAVVGGGDTAFEEALFLTKFASKVYIIHRSAVFRASAVMIQRAQNEPKIEFLTENKIQDAVGENNQLTHLLLISTKNNSMQELIVSGLFYAIGHTPNTEFLKYCKIQLDDNGYILTKNKSTHTNLRGVFAAGDVQDKIYRQAITSAGTGCMAALDAVKYLQENIQNT